MGDKDIVFLGAIFFFALGIALLLFYPDKYAFMVNLWVLAIKVRIGWLSIALGILLIFLGR